MEEPCLFRNRTTSSVVTRFAAVEVEVPFKAINARRNKVLRGGPYRARLHIHSLPPQGRQVQHKASTSQREYSTGAVDSGGEHARNNEGYRYEESREPTAATAVAAS